MSRGEKPEARIPDRGLTAVSAEPGTPAHDSLQLLASWAATLDQDSTAEL